jgi:hypothetical protein
MFDLAYTPKARAGNHIALSAEASAVMKVNESSPQLKDGGTRLIAAVFATTRAQLN